MTDRELLELAAKAAGLHIDFRPCASNMDDYELKGIGGPYINNVGWNPLTDDGDALRLAVKLRLQIKTPQLDGDIALVRWRDYGKDWSGFIDGGDVREPFQETRRAIVRAAAEIGKGMP